METVYMANRIPGVLNLEYIYIYIQKGNRMLKMLLKLDCLLRF